MNCQAKGELVSQLVALNNKLSLLSPDLVHGEEERDHCRRVERLRRYRIGHRRHDSVGTDPLGS